MFEFVNWGLVVITGLLLIVGFGLFAGEKKEEKCDQATAYWS